MTVLHELISAAHESPAEWRDASINDVSPMHQLAPYIGKLKPIIARRLIQDFSDPGDTILDCFAGSGTVPLEAALLGRRVLAYDSNPYAISLTRAKLEAPECFDAAEARMRQRFVASLKRPRYNTHEIPDWVAKFFHPETLQNALRFADECIAADDQFLLACLLSILHHQRPGFLSYPSSHLVPYLRDRKFPQAEYPEMYEERDLPSRLLAKIKRCYKRDFTLRRELVVAISQRSVADLRVAEEIDAVITSPPYMNALDYVRDNRLRMWFLDRSTANYSPEPTEKQNQSDAITKAFCQRTLGALKTGGYCVLIVGETVRRKRITSHPADRIFAHIMQAFPSMRLERVIQDEIPDVRRSRRTGTATKRELIMVLQKM